LRILNIRGDLILIAAATPTNPGNVYIYNCRTEGKQQIQVTPIISNLTLEKIKESIEHRVLELNSKVHIVLLKPKFTEKKLPLIIIPHGGPNSVYSVDYVFYPIVFARLGFAVASSKRSAPSILIIKFAV
jgi:dipeptidyl aminopeptidase/acylaminoacyl peptidase